MHKFFVYKIRKNYIEDINQDIIYSKSLLDSIKEFDVVGDSDERNDDNVSEEFLVDNDSKKWTTY